MAMVAQGQLGATLSKAGSSDLSCGLAKSKALAQ